MKEPIVILPLKQYEEMKEELKQSKSSVELWKANLAGDVILASIPYLKEMSYSNVGGMDVVREAAQNIARDVIKRIERR